MRATKFAPNEYYHLYGRGSEKKTIFHDAHDYSRFIFLLLYFQSPTPINNIGWYANSFQRSGNFRMGGETLGKILKDRYVELTSFALMPNHFHLLVKNLSDAVISVYMQRILTAYSKYYNAKYSGVGHVFQGPFGATHIKKNEQLLHLSAYIHKNPNSLKEWADNYKKYPWSSCQDYLGTNRWDKLLKPDLVQKQFSSQTAYEQFLDSSKAKEFLTDLLD